MIPLVLPALHALGVLVTRPQLQAANLCARLQQHGAFAMNWPALCIEPVEFDASTIAHCDLLIFISTNAVIHGSGLLERFPAARVVAVGEATGKALTDAGQILDITPNISNNSEALLAHPLLMTPPPQVTLVRGRGGRELLVETLTARGAQVSVAEVYTRTAVTPAVDALQTLTDALANDALHVVTATSVETVEALHATLPPALLGELQARCLLCGSTRIAAMARSLGWHGELVVANNPTDAAMLRALQRWHTRQH